MRKKTILTVVVALVLALGINARGPMLRVMQQDDSQAEDTTVKVQEDVINEASIVDEVIWVVGDEPILKSDVEAMRLQGEAEGIHFPGDPDCSIPEQIAVQKLYLHQAAIDSIEVTESEISMNVEQQINYWLQLVGGSKEKLEEYRKQTIAQMRSSMHDDFRDRQLIQKMQEKLVEDIKVSPADVRMYFKDLPEDSIPFVPTAVEVQIVTLTPRIEQEEINRVKDELQLDYTGRGMLDPAFANVAFNLTDPKKISKIVETEFGFHIIQLIDKRGDKIKCRHILLKPHVSPEALEKAQHRLDSIANDIRAEKFSFDEAATYISDDKDTRSSKGLMANTSESGRTSKFRMQDLPTEVARVVDTLKVGQVSDAFQMINSKGKTVTAIVKLKSRVDGHRATITEDFQEMKNVVLAKRRQSYLKEWVKDKLKTIYVRMNDRYKDCQFEYEGWIK